MSVNVQYPIPVLFTHFGDQWIRGSEMLLLDLMKGLDKSLVRPVVWCNGDMMAEVARDAGFPTYQTDFRIMLDYGAPKSDLGAFLGVVRTCRTLCRTHGIKVLHANSAAPLQWLAPAACSLRLPTVGHLHTTYLRRSRYVLLVHAANHLVGVSHGAISGPASDGVSPASLQVIYNGIDLGRLRAPEGNVRRRLGIADDAMLVASAGSLIKRKGHDVLIRSIHALAPTDVPVHLVVMGDGPERGSLQGLVDSLGISDRVHFLGHIENTAEIYSAADLFALASREEAFGLVLAEAGHFGLPSVSTLVGGIPEVVLNETTGILVPPDDVESFSGALSRLIADRELRERMGNSAAARVDSNFTLPKMARQFEKLYARLSGLPASDLGWIALARRVSGPYMQFVKSAFRASSGKAMMETTATR